MNFKNLSLKNKILVVVLPIIVISLSVVAYAIYLEVGDYVVRDMVSSTNEASQSLGKWLQEGTGQLEQNITLLHDKPRDPETQMAVLLSLGNRESFLRKYPDGFAGVTIYMSGIGEEYMADRDNIKMAGRIDARALEYYHDFIIGRTGSQVSLSGYTNASGKRGICILSSVTDGQGQAYGILGYRIFPETVLKKLAETPMPYGSRVILMDKEGTPFLFAEEDLGAEKREFARGRGLADKDGIYQYQWDGGKRMVFYQPVPSTSWQLAIAIDETKLMTKAKSLLAPILLVILIVLVVSVLALLAVARHITRPIEILEQAISRVSKDDLSLEKVEIDSADELGRLARSFENMVASLRHVKEERDKAFECMRISEDKYMKAFNSSSELVAITTVEDGRYVEVNEAMHTIFGFTREEVIGRTSLELGIRRSEDERTEFAQIMLAHGKVRNLEVEHYTKDGEKKPGLLSAELIEFNGERCIISTIRDITELKEAEKELRYMGSHDALTGLYNRAYFEREMNLLKQGNILPVAFIICDVDGLKLVNDTMGHVAGDRLLKRAAKVLEQATRGEYVTARIGGDEFAVLLAGISYSQVEEVCHRIRTAAENYNQSAENVLLSMSVGFALSEQAGPVNILGLFKEADNNMYREKLHRSRSARSAIVQTVMKLLEARDFITEGHGVRMQDLAAALAKECGAGETGLTDIRLLAQFHDIGKVGIPDRILLKPGALTLAEKEEMKRHAEIGHRIALSSPDLLPIADWILKHHEWWDGNGYPLGLKGSSIPLECRILSIVDAYDAMTNDRPYRSAMSKAEAIQELKRCAGKQFDPRLVELFVNMLTNAPYEELSQKRA